jgi:ubiquinone biosynthesis protein UbiJ
MKQLLEKAINRYLALDFESEKRIALLQGKTVTLELTGIFLTLQMIFTNNAIELKWNDFNTPDLTIRGTPLNLLHMKIAREKRQQFFAEDIVIEGNMELAQQVLAVFDELEIDWEDYFSKWLGDVPAYHTGRFLNHVKNVKQKMQKSFSYNLNEYIHEEINLFPAGEALQLFFHDIDDLRMDVDRLEARILKLKEAL